MHYYVWSKSLMFVALWLQVGLIIGKGGETIKYLQQQSGARIQVARDADSDS
jgi:far upstream element-binding protein